MHKFIHITDIHLVEQGRALYGHDPGKRFERCIDSVIIAILAKPISMNRDRLSKKPL